MSMDVETRFYIIETTFCGQNGERYDGTAIVVVEDGVVTEGITDSGTTPDEVYDAAGPFNPGGAREILQSQYDRIYRKWSA